MAGIGSHAGVPTGRRLASAPPTRLRTSNAGRSGDGGLVRNPSSALELMLLPRSCARYTTYTQLAAQPTGDLSFPSVNHPIRSFQFVAGVARRALALCNPYLSSSIPSRSGDYPYIQRRPSPLSIDGLEMPRAGKGLAASGNNRQARGRELVWTGVRDGSGRNHRLARRFQNGVWLMS
jgi:hypothetical protein